MLRKKSMLRSIVYGAGGLLVALMTVTNTATAASDTSRHGTANCDSTITIPVALAPGQPADATLSGVLCQPKHHGKSSSVDILVHGATYDRSYWDFGYQHPQYSYIQQAIQDGRTVFFYDRLGNGKSSRLDSTRVTMAADAYALHQVITYLEKHEHFRTINVVGHSFGSLISQLEASQYTDIDRLVITDALQSTGPVLVNGLLQMVSANQVPQFAGAGYDDGWQVSKLGTKGAFYNTATADPNVIAYDETHQGVASSTQLAEGRIQRVLPPDTNPIGKIKAPVLIVVGEQDGLYCGLAVDCTNKQAVLDFEKPYYKQARRLDVVTIPDSGHDINLQSHTADVAKNIDKWLRTTPVNHWPHH